MGFGDLRQTDWDHQFRSYNVPAGSFVNTPTVFQEDLGHVWLDSLIVEDTAQVAGKVGYRLLLAGGIIVPANAAQFTYVGGFGGRQPFEVGIEVDRQVVVHGINFGQFPHFVFVTYKTTDIRNAIAAGLVGNSGGAAGAGTSPSTVATSAPITVLQPPTSPSGGPSVPTLTLPPPATDLSSLIAAVTDLQARVATLEQEVVTLQAQGLASPPAPSSAPVAAGGTQPPPVPSPPVIAPVTPANPTGVVPVTIAAQAPGAPGAATAAGQAYYNQLVGAGALAYATPDQLRAIAEQSVASGAIAPGSFGIPAKG